METTWDDLMQGVKRYAEYCKTSGKEGSDFVVAPESFFKDEIYLETFTHQAAEDPKKADGRRMESERMQRAVDGAIQAGSALRPHPQEPAAAFETRIMLEKNNPHPQSRGTESSVDGANAARLGSGIANLTARMRIAK